VIHEGAPDTFSPLNQNVIPNLNQSSTSTSITTEPETPKGNITRLIEQEFEGSGIRYGFVYVMYESPTIVVLKADALTPVVAEYNINLWKAVDLLRLIYPIIIESMFDQSIKFINCGRFQ
jgi:hypothetical protein